MTPTSEAHPAVMDRTRGKLLGLAGHATFETYSVLTRLPGALRLSASAARTIIATNFPASVHLLGRDAARALDTLAAAGIAGGSVYDGLVALAAGGAGIPLISCDRRAAPTYAALGIAVELV